VIFVAGVIVHKLLVSRVTGIRGSAARVRSPLCALILTLGVAVDLQTAGFRVRLDAGLDCSRSHRVLGTGSGLRRCHPIRKSGQTVAVCSGGGGARIRAVHGQSRLGKSLRAAADNAAPQSRWA